MAYRDDLDAASARADAAEREVARLHALIASWALAEDAQATAQTFVGVGGSVLGLDRRTGQHLWERKLVGRENVLVIWDGNVLLAATRGEVFRLDPRSGAVVWHNKLTGFGWGLPSLWLAPLGRLFVGLKGHVLRLAIDTGDVIWKTKVCGNHWVGLAVVGTDVLVGFTGKIRAVDGERGTVRWSDDLPGMGQGLVSFGATSSAAVSPGMQQQIELAAAAAAAAAS